MHGFMLGSVGIVALAVTVGAPATQAGSSKTVPTCAGPADGKQLFAGPARKLATDRRFRRASAGFGSSHAVVAAIRRQRRSRGQRQLLPASRPHLPASAPFLACCYGELVRPINR